LRRSYVGLGGLIWVIGVVIAVVLGLSFFGVYEVPYLLKQLAPGGSAELWSTTGPGIKALFVACGLLGISKLI
jgi:hypothetical protein